MVVKKFFSFIWMIIILFKSIYSEPWLTIPLKYTNNKVHIVATLSVGYPISYNVDIVMDTGSALLYIFQSLYNTSSFRCVCKYDEPNLLHYIHNTTYNGSNYLTNCPVLSKQTCENYGELCEMGAAIFFSNYNNNTDSIPYNNFSTTIVNYCQMSSLSQSITVDTEKITLTCDKECYSGFDYIQFATNNNDTRNSQ